MIKDFTRDYATAAFRMWASMGCPSYETAAEQLKKKENAQDVLRGKHSAELYDILACEETFAVLDKNRKYISNAVREVYMIDPTHEPKRGEVTARVLRYALEVPASEVQVYRWLRSARELFCEFRGLRTGSE